MDQRDIPALSNRRGSPLRADSDGCVHAACQRAAVEPAHRHVQVGHQLIAPLEKVLITFLETAILILLKHLIG